MEASKSYLPMQCRSCGGDKVRIFLDLGDQPHCNRLLDPKGDVKAEKRYPLRAGFCEDCTLVQIDATIPKEDMFIDFPYVTGTTKTLVQHFNAAAERLAQTYKLSAQDCVVDIGSNDGTWLRGFQKHGIRVLGVEPAPDIVALAITAGVPTLQRFFNEETAALIKTNAGSAKLITAAGVFFHLEELHSVTRGIKNLLAPDGIFVVQAIDLVGMVKNLAFDQIYHEHLCYYTLRSLQGLLARHGLEVVDYRNLPIHGGSMEVHCAHQGTRAVTDAVKQRLANEDAEGFGRYETYVTFAARVWDRKKELLAILEDYKRQGKVVHAFGAPAKGATLVNSFKIGRDLVAAAVERNPLKFGKLFPGAHFPILDEEKTPKADAYLMLAWNFLDEFLERERPYLEKGGAFILPVPEVKVITAANLPRRA